MNLKNTIKTLPFSKWISRLIYGLRYENVKKIDLVIEGHNLTFNTDDEYSKKWFIPRYLGGKIHEPCLSKLIVESLTQDSCFIDVGANLGYFTCLAAKLCQFGSVHAFEMDHNCIPLIRNNLRANSCNNTTINCLAVSNELGSIEIPDESLPNPELMIATSETRKTKTVLTTTLDSYVSKAGIIPNLIKIDAEGAEMRILQGATNLLKTNRPKIFVEIHCEKLKQYQSSPEAVIALLIEHGYTITQIVDHRSTLMDLRPLGDVDSLKGNILVLAV